MQASPKHLAIIYWIAMAVIGCLDLILPASISSSPAYYWGTAVVLVFVGFNWFIADARVEQADPSTGLKIAVVALMPIALTYYRIRYKGFGAGMRFLGIITLLFALIFSLQYVLTIAMGME